MENLTEKEQIKILEHYISELCKYAEETAVILGLDTSATILGKGCIEYWAVLSSASNNAIKKLLQENKELKERLVRTEEDLKYQCVDCMNVKSDRYRKALEEIEAIIKDFNDNRLCFYDDINDCQNCDMNTDCNYLRKFKILDIINKAKGEGICQ